MAHSAVMN